MIVLGYDPGTATGALAAAAWEAHRPRYLTSSSWVPLPGDLAATLGSIAEWLESRWVRLPGATPVDLMAIEDQRFSRLPGALKGRTSAAAVGPLMAQSVAMAWAARHGIQVVLVQPMSARKVSVGRASGFRCPVKLPPQVVARAKRAHVERLYAIQERAICAMIKDCPPGLTDHEYAAISVAMAGKWKLAKLTAADKAIGRRLVG